MDDFLEWDRFSEKLDRTWNPDTAMARYRAERGLPPLRQKPSPAQNLKAQHAAKVEQKRRSELELWAEREALRSLARTIAGPEKVAPAVTTPYRTRR